MRLKRKLQILQLLDSFMPVAFIPFVVADSQYFKDAVSSVTKCGAGYRPSSRFEISGRLLSNKVSNADNKLTEFKKQVSITGNTLTSDGWSNV